MSKPTSAAAAALDRDSIRRKSAFSCEPCRRRKVKCDGNQPVCNRCTSRNETCVYKLSPSLNYTKTLENRIASLETALAAATSQSTGSQHAASRPMPVLPPMQPPTKTTVELFEEATASIPGLRRDDRGHVSFHGRTSLMSLGASQSPQRNGVGSPSTTDLDGGKQELINSAWTERALEKLSNLPEAIQILLDMHWCWVQPLFNFIYRPTFTRDLKSNGPYCSVLLLNAVLSHSVRWAKADKQLLPLLEPFDHGAYFGRQARAGLMEALQSGPPSIPTVQALLLLSAQECGQGHLTQAWLFSGMAFRLLEDLGIVFDGRKFAGSVQFSVEDIEIRNRLFWGCYFWDKLISLYLGRTPVLQETSVSPPRQILDDTSEIDIWTPQGLDQASTAEYPPTQAHTTSCFINTCALSEILNVILITMYNPAGTSTVAEVAKCATDAESRLTAWYSQLPAHLKMDLSPLPEYCPPSHIVTLNCLYHTTQILLHRPLLTTYGKQGSDESRHEHHLRQCLESANATLLIFSLFRRTFGDGHVILSQAYTVYTAASIFLLQIQATKDYASQAMDNLRYSVDALERIKATSPVLGSVLASLYRALQELDPKLIVRDAEGEYRISSTPQGTEQQTTPVNGAMDGAHPAWNAQQGGFAVPDFHAFDIPSDLFMMLPEIEPITATVNAGYDINLDDNWL